MNGRDHGDLLPFLPFSRNGLEGEASSAADAGDSGYNSWFIGGYLVVNDVVNDGYLVVIDAYS